MAMLEPKLAVLDETDSGLDIDALRIVADGVNALRGPDRAMLVITHYQRLLDYIVPDRVHVLVDGSHREVRRQEPRPRTRGEGLRLDPGRAFRRRSRERLRSRTMATAIPFPEHRERAHAALQERLPEAPPWAAALRTGALDRVRELGFPTTRDEDWKYTSVRSVVDVDWGVEGGTPPESAPLVLPGFRGPRLTFVNGRYDAGLSDPKELPEGVLLGSLAEVLVV